MVKPYEPLYTVKEAAAVLKTNPRTVYNYISEGLLVCIRLGTRGVFKIRGTDLESFINSCPGQEPGKEEPHAKVL
nr:helix-turn-helix domain-containing protein [uncultured Clostridium sp.]